MDELEDESIHLIVTSPPYNVEKEYEIKKTLEKYLKILSDVFTECKRVLVPGGRICINVANIHRKPFCPLHKHIMEICLERLNLLMRGEIIWFKGASGRMPTAWGSWRSANDPYLRDIHEYILVFSKDQYSRDNPRGKSTLTKQEFLDYTKSVWTMQTDGARVRKIHPAPFPVELPSRCIKLFSFEGDTVLDPFMGSGTTLEAALTLKRNAIGYDKEHKYVQYAKNRVSGINGLLRWLE